MKPKAPKKKDATPNCKTGEVSSRKEYKITFGDAELNWIPLSFEKYARVMYKNGNPVLQVSNDLKTWRDA